MPPCGRPGGRGISSVIVDALALPGVTGLQPAPDLAPALHAVVAKMAKIFSTRVYLFLPILTLVFGLICTTQGVNLFIAFAPIMVMMAFAMGLDSITGASIILLGGAIGFSTGPLNINTTIVAQKIAGLPLYSGVGYRFICFAVFYVITNIYLIRYALKIQKHPELSPMYEIDKTSEFRNAADLDAFGKLDARKILIMLVFFASLILIVYGGIKLDWDMAETASVFLALAVIEGVLGGFGPSAISKEFLEGCKKMLGAAFIIGIFRRNHQGAAALLFIPGHTGKITA